MSGYKQKIDGTECGGCHTLMSWPHPVSLPISTACLTPGTPIMISSARAPASLNSLRRVADSTASD